MRERSRSFVTEERRSFRRNRRVRDGVEIETRDLVIFRTHHAVAAKGLVSALRKLALPAIQLIGADPALPRNGRNRLAAIHYEPNGFNLVFSAMLLTLGGHVTLPRQELRQA